MALKACRIILSVSGILPTATVGSCAVQWAPTVSAGTDSRRVDLREGDVTGNLGDPAPVDRVAEAEHIAAVYVFLVSATNSRMTDQVLFADGGFDALRRGVPTAGPQISEIDALSVVRCPIVSHDHP